MPTDVAVRFHDLGGDVICHLSKKLEQRLCCSGLLKWVVVCWGLWRIDNFSCVCSRCLLRMASLLLYLLLSLCFCDVVGLRGCGELKS